MPVTFKHRTLDNGLDVVGEIDPDAHTASSGVFVRTGARDEDSTIMGVSHFLEHMMFKGTDDISAEQLNLRFDAMGARNNAYTTSELTCFYAHTLPEHAMESTSLITEMMSPALRVEDFDTEKGVILEEIAMYADEPFWVLYEEVMAARYAGKGLGHRVLGTSDTVSALERDQMQTYFRDRYSADNSVFAFAGAVDFDSACDTLERLSGHWLRTGAGRDNARPETVATRLDLKRANVSRGYALMFWEGPGFDDDRRYAAALLSQVLGAAENSRLHWALIEPGIAEEAQAGFEAHDGIGDFYAYVSGDPEKLDDMLGILDTEIANVVDSVDSDDLARLRSRFATSFTVGGERPADRMQRVGRRWAARGDYIPLDDELERINAVTLDDLAEVARSFGADRRTVGTLRPGD